MFQKLLNCLHFLKVDTVYSSENKRDFLKRPEFEVNRDKTKLKVFWGVPFINSVVHYKAQEIKTVKYCKI